MLIVYVCLVMFAAACVQGVGGFGFALIAAPLLPLFISARESVLFILLATSLINIYLLLRFRRQIEMRKLRTLLFPTIVGIGGGLLVLSGLDDGVLGIMMGLGSLSLAVALILGRKKRFTSSGAVRGAGLLAGFSNVTAGLGGPPMVFLLEEQHVQKKRMVGDLAAYFMVLNIFSLTGMALTEGIAVRATPGLAAVVLSVALGLAAGIRLGDSLKGRQFHRAVIALVIVSGSIVLINGFLVSLWR